MNPRDAKGREELWNQLSHAIDLRSSQDQVLWSIFGFFGAANAVLLAALFASGGFPKDPWVPVVVVSAGILLSITWQLISSRALGHISRHEALMKAIEYKLQIPQTLAVSAAINFQSYQIHVASGIPARVLLARFGWGAAALWIFVAVICFAKKFSCLQ